MHERYLRLLKRCQHWAGCVGTAAVLSCACASSADRGASEAQGGAPSSGGALGGAGAAAGTSHGGAAGTSAGSNSGSSNSGSSNSAGQTNGGAAGSQAGSSAGVSGGGSAGSAGSLAMGGAGAGGGMAGGNALGPCDIYAKASTPCVAAHSTVRALYAHYDGALYQLRRASDKTTRDVPTLGPGGFVDIGVQNTFCSGTSCTISVLYDQSPQKNDLVKSGVAHWLPNGGVEANASDGKVRVSGHEAHGIYVTANSNVAYRNNATKGVAKGDQPEAMYMVLDGKRYSSVCCFDYGNAETSGNDDGNGTMEAIYWGSDITWGGKGAGNGPWIAADLENGMFKGDKGGWQSQSVFTPSAQSVIATYATTLLKGPSGNHFTLKAGNAQSGTLITMWDGVRPAPGYSPKKLQGAIILGTGGDGSNGGTGTFFEGAMTSGTPPDAVDEEIQANIVAAAYGR